MQLKPILCLVAACLGLAACASSTPPPKPVTLPPLDSSITAPLPDQPPVNNDWDAIGEAYINLSRAYGQCRAQLRDAIRAYERARGE
ncbi:Rz1-like lysis system protein LysC [Chitinibacteraceae bacterium HSL-7]